MDVLLSGANGGLSRRGPFMSRHYDRAGVRGQLKDTRPGFELVNSLAGAQWGGTFERDCFVGSRSLGRPAYEYGRGKLRRFLRVRDGCGNAWV